MNERNLGRFRIDEKWLHAEPDKVATVFAILKCVPVRIEVLFTERCLEYLAIAEQFPEVPYANMIPEYILEIKTDSAGWPVRVEVR